MIYFLNNEMIGIVYTMMADEIVLTNISKFGYVFGINITKDTGNKIQISSINSVIGNTFLNIEGSYPDQNRCYGKDSATTPGAYAIGKLAPT